MEKLGGIIDSENHPSIKILNAVVEKEFIYKIFKDQKLSSIY